MSDQIYMRRCFDLARMAGRYTLSNPQVGAVIVHNGRIIGEGFHQHYGLAHAEVNALESVKEEDQHLLKESTIYVSLEPCNHHGKTGPCSKAILNAKIPKVVVSCLDPNPIVAGKSIDTLRAAGLEVITHVCESEGQKLIAPFKANLQKRPFVILKWAQSSDGFLGKEGNQTWLTNDFTNIETHKWRSQVDGIIVGKNTFNIDRPLLTTRHWHGGSPIRIVVDSNLSMNENAYHGVKTLVINQTKESKSENLEFVRVSDTRNIEEVLDRLYQLGFYKIIIEGGSQLLQSFIDTLEWDEARIITTPVILSEGIAIPKIKGTQIENYNIENDHISILKPND